MKSKPGFNIFIFVFIFFIGFMVYTTIVNIKPYDFEHNKKIRIVIDPGHGGRDTGSIQGGVYEKDINLLISKNLKKYLQKNGYTVIMTRERDVFLTLGQRTRIANKVKPAVFVSIHANSAPNVNVRGVEIYWYSPKARQLAHKIQYALSNNKTIRFIRGSLRSRYFVIYKTYYPAVLVETGYMSNYYERQELLTSSRQKIIAKTIGDGIIQYLRSSAPATKKQNYK